MTNIDPEKIADILRRSAARYITPRFNKLEQHEIREKGSPNNLVTIADTDMNAR